MQYVVQTAKTDDEQIKPIRAHKSDDFIKNPSEPRKPMDAAISHKESNKRIEIKSLKSAILLFLRQLE